MINRMEYKIIGKIGGTFIGIFQGNIHDSLRRRYPNSRLFGRPWGSEPPNTTYFPFYDIKNSLRYDNVTCEQVESD